MPFEQGPMTCRLLQLPRTLPDDAVDRFAAAAAPPLNGSGHAAQGWVTGQHLLDRTITREKAYYGGYLRLTLLKAERKVPASLLRAECRMEEIAQLAATDAAFLSGKRRAEIKREVEDRLRPTMPPTLTGIPFVHHESTGILFAGASSTKQLDTFVSYLVHTLGFAPIPLRADTLAMERHHADVRDWRPSSFVTDRPPDQDEVQPGREFLTWLWFLAEARGGEVATESAGRIALAIDGPLVLVHEGQGAHESVLRKGAPPLSAEARTGLLGGKKLRQATLLLNHGDDTYSFGFDADEFLVRSLKVPDSDAADSLTRFQDRMIHLDTLRGVLLDLFDVFLEERNHPATWSKTCLAMNRWIQEKPTRA